MRMVVRHIEEAMRLIVPDAPFRKEDQGMVVIVFVDVLRRIGEEAARSERDRPGICHSVGVNIDAAIGMVPNEHRPTLVGVQREGAHGFGQIGQPRRRDALVQVRWVEGIEFYP